GDLPVPPPLARQSARELVEQRLFRRRQLALERRLLLEQRLSIGEILQALGSTAGWVAAGAQLLVKQIDDAEDLERHAGDGDRDRALDGAGERGVVCELHRSSGRSDPIVAVLVPTGRPKSGSHQRAARQLTQTSNGDVDVERGSRLLLM